MGQPMSSSLAGQQAVVSKADSKAAIIYLA